MLSPSVTVPLQVIWLLASSAPFCRTQRSNSTSMGRVSVSRVYDGYGWISVTIEESRVVVLLAGHEYAIIFSRSLQVRQQPGKQVMVWKRH